LYTKDTEGSLIWKITDFGFSAPSSEETVTTIVNPLTMGHMTRNYCAPEVIIGSRYDQKADIWSAGCILYELATGNPPFSTEDAVRQYAWSGMLIPPVSELRGETIGRRVDWFVGVMMQVAPEMRPGGSKIIEAIPRDCHCPL
jgi:serine/threonine protein kinase